ncbi:MAG TPA: AlkA N-terminal domain-containing protein [Gammaproteobacteria bacterium]|nr:AlkA N-terminal domain-containing protein [Gammaproteobacteria bacterium]
MRSQAARAGTVKRGSAPLTGTLSAHPPLHLEATVRALQRRPTNLVDTWENGRYRRLLVTARGAALVEIENRGTVDAPALRWTVLLGARHIDRHAIAPVFRRMLGLDMDPAPLAEALAAVPELRAEAAALRGMRPPRFASLLDTVINVVPFQQLSLDAGTAILSRLVERYGASVVHDGRRYFAFPSGAVLARARLDGLRACGLSTGKAAALRSLAREIDAGRLSESELDALPTPDARERLIAIPGIGPWSAAIVLLRGLGRLDVFPPGDAGALRGLRSLLQMPRDSVLEPVIERLGERRGYLYFCLLGRSLLGKGLIEAAPPVRAEPPARES